MKYQSGGAFRRALEQRLRTRSLQTGVPLVRLRKMVSFDRFLSRLLRDQPRYWVVKGGLALQLRLGERGRTTKDLDVLSLLQKEEITDALRNAGALNIGDWFTFDVAEPVPGSAGEPGGTRYAIQAMLDSRTFEQFHMDVGIGDPVLDPVEYLTAPDLLGFANIEPARIPCYPITQQIAEKLHAYTRPHQSGDTSRVKDFIDILLMAEMGTLDGQRLLLAIQATFSALGTHGIPRSLVAPPASWTREYQRMAIDVGLSVLSLDQAFDLFRGFLDPILQGNFKGKWDAAGWTWQ